MWKFLIAVQKPARESLRDNADSSNVIKFEKNQRFERISTNSKCPVGDGGEKQEEDNLPKMSDIYEYCRWIETGFILGSRLDVLMSLVKLGRNRDRTQSIRTIIPASHSLSGSHMCFCYCCMSLGRYNFKSATEQKTALYIRFYSTCLESIVHRSSREETTLCSLV